jgi:hypothetical protein
MECLVESAKKASPLAVKRNPTNSIGISTCDWISASNGPIRVLHAGINKGANWYFITEPVNENTSIHDKVNLSFEQW